MDYKYQRGKIFGKCGQVIVGDFPAGGGGKIGETAFALLQLGEYFVAASVYRAVFDPFHRTFQPPQISPPPRRKVGCFLRMQEQSAEPRQPHGQKSQQKNSKPGQPHQQGPEGQYGGKYGRRAQSAQSFHCDFSPFSLDKLRILMYNVRINHMFSPPFYDGEKECVP